MGNLMTVRRAGRSGPRARRDEQGVLWIMMVVLCTALFALAGAVVDLGGAIAAHARAVGEAEQAARAGANALSADSLRAGGLQPDPSAAVAAAETYMTQAGHPGTAQVNGNIVTATVSPYQKATTFLGLVGIASFTITGHGAAQAVTRYSPP
jgi:Flp pilus assembly protein TadG